MKKNIFALACLVWLPLAAVAGDITPGSVPGTINYQGRLEMDNAPVTGPVHLYFRIYSALTGGTLLWTSPELLVTAAQGIFSASLTPPWTLFSKANTDYLEVQVEGDVLSPRELLNSVAYALVARKLEDGSSVSVTTFTANYQVLLATNPSSNVGIGTNSPGTKLTVNGGIELQGADAKVCWPHENCLYAPTVATQSGGMVADGNSLIESGNGGVGEMHFNTGNGTAGGGTSERMRMNDGSNDGTIAMGPAAINSPKAGATLDVDGTIYVSTWGISERSGGPVPLNGSLLVKGGRFTGGNSDYLSVGEASNVIALVTGTGEALRVHSNGFVGVGTQVPAYRLDVNGDLHTNTGLLAGAVSAGAYGGWPAAANEIRAGNGSSLLLQENNPYNVGIGTDTPREKLHVHGSVRADYGVIAATAAFSGPVSVNGNFTANSGNLVTLSTTTVYGTLTVTGGIGSMAGLPAYIASTQTFTGLNTFSGELTVSSDIVTPSRMGVAMKDFNFSGGRYLQVGDNKGEYSSQDTLAYIVGGDAANAKLEFYRGGVLSGGIETQGGANLATVVGGQVKTLTDSVYHRIQNSVVWISTGYAGTPAIYVSSQAGNVGIGTVVSDPNYKLTLNGDLHIIGTGSAIYFQDGTHMNSAASIGSATSLSNNGDVLIQANVGGGGGSVILRSGSIDGLAADSGGNIGIGTLTPVSKLTVRGGDLVLGTPIITPYSSNGIEDLIVAGNIVFDGALIQRSALQTHLSGLVVAGNVYLSTGTSMKTGVGTSAPYTEFDVNGDAQFGSGVNKSTFTAAGALQLNSPLAVAYGGTGAGTLTGILKGNGTSTVTALTGNAGYNTYWTDANTIAAEQYTAVSRGGTGVGTLTGIVHGNGAGVFTASNVALGSEVSGLLAVNYGGSGADLSGVATGGLIYKSGAATLNGTGALYGVVKATNGGVPTVMTGTANTLTKWTDNYTVGNSVITDDGTTVNVNTHKIINVTDPGSAQDAATKNYVDSQLTGGLGTTWSRTGNAIQGTDWLGSNNSQAVVIKTANTTAMTITTGQIVQLTNALGVAYGGTGAGDAATARTNLGLGTISTQGAGAVSITGGTLSGITSLTMGGTLNLNSNNITNGGTITATTFSGALSGNATTATTATTASSVTNGVYTNGNQTIGGIKTFSNTIDGDINGNAATATTASSVTNGVYTNGNQTIGGTKTFSNTIAGDINGNAATCTKPSGGGSTNHAVCWKSDGTLGYCSAVVASDGTCGTCN